MTCVLCMVSKKRVKVRRNAIQLNTKINTSVEKRRFSVLTDGNNENPLTQGLRRGILYGNRSVRIIG